MASATAVLEILASLATSSCVVIGSMAFQTSKSARYPMLASSEAALDALAGDRGDKAAVNT